jgi:hypothetical protein
LSESAQILRRSDMTLSAISDIAPLIRTTKEAANRSAPLGQFVSRIFADPAMRKTK